MGIDRQFLFLKLILEKLCQLIPHEGLATDTSHCPVLIGLASRIIKVSSNNGDPWWARDVHAKHVDFKIPLPFAPCLRGGVKSFNVQLVQLFGVMHLDIKCRLWQISAQLCTCAHVSLLHSKVHIMNSCGRVGFWTLNRISVVWLISSWNCHTGCFF